jgi:dTDP-4-dehydrorhamnose reductase
MRILLTGREGQVARSLLEKGPGFPGLELIPAGRPEADLAEPGSIARVIRTVAPDLVINAAAYTAVDLAEDEPDVAFRINAEAPAKRGSGPRTGVGHHPDLHRLCFRWASCGAIRRGAPTNPVSIYGRSKLAGEEGGPRCQSRAPHPANRLGLQPVRPQFRQDHGCRRPRP